MEFVWSDKQGHRDRKAWLLLVTPEGKVMPFAGETIPGVAAITGTDFYKQGKWSHTTYRLALAPGVRPIAGRDGWETGRFVEGLGDAVSTAQPIDRWSDVANALGVTISEAMRFLRAWRPRAAEALDKVEEDLVSLNDERDGDDFVIAAISFGGPTNRAIAAGFWEWPVQVIVDGKVVGKVVPEGCGWQATGQVRVVAFEHISGYHGGFVSLRLAVPNGAQMVHAAD